VGVDRGDLLEKQPGSLIGVPLNSSVRQIAVEHAGLLVYPWAMQTEVDLKQMALPEKLRLMEALWDELCSREEELPVPDWHKEVLDERERQIVEGKATFVDWETAKARIRNRIP
jgi:putative addiction module component (TIGR02574 family)